MQITAILPLFLACANALLIPSLSGADTSSYISKATKETAISQPQYKATSFGYYPRDNETVSIDDNDNIPVEDNDPQQYIVVFEHGHSKGEYNAHNDWISDQFSASKKRGDLENLPSNVSDEVTFYNLLNFKGYTAYLPPTLLEAIQSDPLVAFVEEDSVVESHAIRAQYDAPWGLARVSQRYNSGSSRYIYDSEGGKGVTAYVLDTGIKVEHPDFEGRASWGISVPQPYTQIDEKGHGSHVAGTIGGKTYGIAKKVNLVAVRVFGEDGKAKVSDIIKGLQYSVKDHQAKVSAKQKGYKGATINMSLGGVISDALDLAVNAVTNAGVHVIVSAGNDDENACNYSPSRSGGAITVGSVDINDRKAKSSNWGECVDINAPGVEILSVGIDLDTAIKSGTSMAAPHVNGLVAYFLSLQPGIRSEFSAGNLVTPAEMRKRIVRYGTRRVLSGLTGNSPNILAFNGAGRDVSEFWSL